MLRCELWPLQGTQAMPPVSSCACRRGKQVHFAFGLSLSFCKYLLFANSSADCFLAQNGVVQGATLKRKLNGNGAGQSPEFIVLTVKNGLFEFRSDRNSPTALDGNLPLIVRYW